MTRANLTRFGVLALIWGASFLFIKVALEGISPPQLVLGRLLFGAFVLGVVVVLRGLRLPTTWEVWKHLVFLAVVANVIPFFLFAWAESGRVTSGLAGVLNGTTPLLTLVIAVAALPEEKVTTTRTVGLAVGFAGVLLIVGPWRSGALAGDGLGLLGCLAAAGCYGVAFNYTKRTLTGRGHASVVLAFGQLGVATAIQLVVVAAVGRHPMTLEWDTIGAVIALGAMGTGLAYLLYYSLIEEVGATTASMVTYLIPVVAVILGVVVLREPVTWNLFVGAGVVIAGVAMADGRLRLGRRGPHKIEPIAVGLESPLMLADEPPT